MTPKEPEKAAREITFHETCIGVVCAIMADEVKTTKEKGYCDGDDTARWVATMEKYLSPFVAAPAPSAPQPVIITDLTAPRPSCDKEYYKQAEQRPEPVPKFKGWLAFGCGKHPCNSSGAPGYKLDCLDCQKQPMVAWFEGETPQRPEAQGVKEQARKAAEEVFRGILKAAWPTNVESEAVPRLEAIILKHLSAEPQGDGWIAVSDSGIDLAHESNPVWTWHPKYKYGIGFQTTSNEWCDRHGRVLPYRPTHYQIPSPPADKAAQPEE